MQQVTPGLFHWTALHEPIGTRVSSYYVDFAKAIIDPKVPEEGLDALPGRPEVILLSSGHHLRDAPAVAEHFGGIPIRCSPDAARRIGSAAEVQAWAAGSPVVTPGITALAIGVLAPDEGALHVDAGDGALLLADAVHPGPDGLSFFPDDLLGDDPQAIKQGLNAALRGLVESLQFDALLFAHGEPLAAGGHQLLREFVERGDEA